MKAGSEKCIENGENWRKGGRMQEREGRDIFIICFNVAIGIIQLRTQIWIISSNFSKTDLCGIQLC